METKIIKIDKILNDNALFIRDNYSQDAVERYKQMYESGKTKPIIVQAKTYKLIDGFHRLKALTELKKQDVEVIEEDIPDKELLAESIKLNLEHGIPLNESERDKNIGRLYEESEQTQEDISEVFHLSQNHVSEILKSLGISKTDKIKPPTIKEFLAGKKPVEITKLLGISAGYVSQILKGFKQDVKSKYQNGSTKEEIVDWITKTYRETTVEKVEEILSESKDLNPALIKLPKLILGDFLEVAKSIPDESVDLILTDPPFGVEYQSNLKQEKFSKLQSDTLDEKQIDNWIKEMFRILKNNKHFYCWVSWKTYPIWFDTISKYFSVKSCLIVKKKHTALGDLKGSFTPSYHMVIFAQKGRRLFNTTTLKEASEASQTDPRTRTDYLQRFPDLILDIDAEEHNLKMVHPTQKSIGICDFFIQISSNEKEIVFDPFAGSGTTLISSKGLNRDWLGVEIEPQWYEVAKKRMGELNG